jgi:RNA polymerase sigma factor (sigma-70 family)
MSIALSFVATRASSSVGPALADARAIMDLEATLTSLVPAVRRWVYRALGPGPDFEDAVQDALVELAKALPRFEGRSQVTTFAHPVVVRTTYRYLARRRERASHGHEIEHATSGDDPERRAAKREQLERLYRVLDRLPDRQRMAFVLCAVERIPHEEAAVMEGVSLETLRQRLKRARAELARRLKADPELERALRGERE